MWPKNIISTYLMNADLVKDTVWGAYPLTYKFNLLAALLGGMWTAMSGLSLALLIVVAILTGANFTLATRRLSVLYSSGGLGVAVGGGSLFGIVGSGCATCGLPILAFLGLSGAIVYLPFRGIELSVIAIILLAVSLYSLVKNQDQKKICALLDSQ